MNFGAARQTSGYGSGAYGTYGQGKAIDVAGKEHKNWARQRAKAQKNLHAHVNWLNDLRKEVTAYEAPGGSSDQGAATRKAGTGEWMV
jgi:hypothetical protein